jgi:hypothetical protein
MTDPLLFTDANLMAQLEIAEFSLGYYTLKFYTEKGKPVNKVTGTVSEFYAGFNLVFYDSRFDTYRGFKPPHLHRQNP